MAAIGAGDVTYTLNVQKKLEDNRKHNIVSIAFGDGAKTYPTGGVPLTSSKMGLPTGQVDSLLFTDESHADGYVYKYDKTNNKVLMYYVTSATTSALTEVANSVTPAATTLIAEVKGW